MKIAIVNNRLNSGGAERLIVDKVLKLQEKNIDVDLVLLTSLGGVYDDEIRSKGINIKYLSDEWTAYSPMNIIKLVKALKGYDVVHVHIFPSQYWVALASFFLPSRIKIVTTEHTATNRRRGKFLFKYLDRIIYSRYRKIVCINKEVEEGLQSWLENDPAKYAIVKNGINLQRFYDAVPLKRENFGLTHKDKVLIMIARFNEQKDHETLVRAMSLLGEEYKLLLLGEGPLREKYEKLAKELKVQSRIQFLGFRKDTPEILKMSDINILSTNFEGQPISIIEAMASGVPTIASEVPGTIELIKENGEFFEHKNYKDLADKILKLGKNSGYAKAMAEKAKLNSKEYSIEKNVDSYLKIYRGIQ